MKIPVQKKRLFTNHGASVQPAASKLGKMINQHQALNVYYPYIGLYMRKIGLTTYETGTIVMAMYFVSFLISPFIGLLADKFRSLKLTTLCACILSAGFSVSLVFVPTRPMTYLSCCDGSICAINDTENVNKTRCFCLEPVNMNTSCYSNTTLQCGDLCKPTAYISDIIFWLVLPATVLGNVFFHSSLSIVNAMTFSLLSNNWANWGRQRLWGCLASVTFVTITGFVLESNSSDSYDVPYHIRFYIYATCMVIYAVCVGMFNITTNLHVRSILQSSRKLITFSFISFYISMICLGFVYGSTLSFLFWYVTEIAESYGYNKNIQIIFAASIAINGVLQVPLFMIAGKVITRFGPLQCLAAGAVLHAIRLASYTFLTNPWYLLLIASILHSLSYTTTETTGTSYVNLHSPPELAAVSQSILQACHDGLGFGLGSVVTGILLDQIGGDWTYRLYALASLFVVFPFILIQLRVRGKFPQKQQLQIQ